MEVGTISFQQEVAKLKILIDEALKDVPAHIEVVVREDIYRRMRDWIANGGEITDSYILQQVRYAKDIGNKCKK